jgi:molecular chaperone GrpE
MTTKKSTSKKKETPDRFTSLKKEIEKLKSELKEKDDQLLRRVADIQNLQKRIDKEIIQCQLKTSEKYICELVDLMELLKKAIDDENPKEGLKLIIENIENFFEKEQIKKIDCVGCKFDHNIHHAVTTIEDEKIEDNTIIEEVKKGFMINDKVVRPSHVIVSKKKEDLRGE